MKFRLIAVALALIATACSSGSKSSDNPTLQGPAPTTTTATALSGAWTTYHHDAARTGVADDQAPIGQVHKVWETPTLDGDVYAQPLVVGGHVIAATEGNSVYAFDAGNGAQAWRAQLGPPVKDSSLPCGNID